MNLMIFLLEDFGGIFKKKYMKYKIILAFFLLLTISCKDKIYESKLRCLLINEDKNKKFEMDSLSVYIFKGDTLLHVKKKNPLNIEYDTDTFIYVFDQKLVTGNYTVVVKYYNRFLVYNINTRKGIIDYFPIFKEDLLNYKIKSNLNNLEIKDYKKEFDRYFSKYEKKIFTD